MDIILDANMFIHKDRCVNPITHISSVEFRTIQEDFRRLSQGMEPYNHRFLIIPTVAVEVLFDIDSRHEFGINMDKVDSHREMINQCYTAPLHVANHVINNASSYFYMNHVSEIERLELALAKCRRHFISEYGVDIFEMSLSESKERITEHLGVVIPSTSSDNWKNHLYDKFSARSCLYHLMLFDIFEDWVINLTMVLFVFCAMFNICGRDNGKKYPLSTDYCRHNFLSDYVIFNYGILRKDSLVLTSDAALAKRGGLIGSTLKESGRFLGVSG